MLLLALATWGCGGSNGGGGSNSPAPGPSPSPSPNTVTIAIVGERGDRSFVPNPATAAGRMVVFHNQDAIVHRVRLNDGSLDTGDIAPGAMSAPQQMPAAGTNYHCPLHPAMIGAVNAAGSAPPPCEGPYC
jgi:plastocyanin